MSCFRCNSAKWQNMKNRKDHHHLNLLCDVSDLAALIAGSENIESFLQRTVEMVARHIKATVCSIYLLDEKLNELVLKATVGFNSEAVGKIRKGWSVRLWKN